MGFPETSVMKIIDCSILILVLKDGPTFHEGLVHAKSDSELVSLENTWAEFEQHCTKKKNKKKAAKLLCTALVLTET